VIATASSVSDSRAPVPGPPHRIRWHRWFIGGVLSFPVLAYCLSMIRVLYGDAQGMTMTEAWATANVSGLAEREVARAQQVRETRAATPAPILDSLVTHWVSLTNAIYPYLIVRATPTRDADVVVVLNPVAYRVWTPTERATMVQELGVSWCAMLATAGAPWPAGYAPRVLVVRAASSHPPGSFASTSPATPAPTTGASHAQDFPVEIANVSNCA
jgi:hypothetical protein